MPGLSMAVAGLMMTGCSADFLDTTPTNRVSTGNVWTTRNLANSVVNGAYERFYYEYTDQWGKLTLDVYTEQCDLDVNWVAGDGALVGGAPTVSSSIFPKWWRLFYEEIYRTSNVIMNLSKVPDMSAEEKARDIAECKFLRAWAYYRANCVWRGVPIYTEPVEYGKATKGRATEDEVWEQILKDCTEAIDEPNLPNKYGTGDANYGRVTKAAALYLRGQVYLWKKDWAKAEADFKAITTMGYSLFHDYKAMFKKANERNDEYIFQYQYTDDPGKGNDFSQAFGNRNTVDYAWNNFIPNPKFVDSYEWADGKPFNIDDVIPGYSSMTPKQRSVYYLRDGLSMHAAGPLASDLRKGFIQMKSYGSDMTKYLRTGNESRKFVIEGRESRTMWDSDIDIPVFRYADVLLCLAEALNEQGKTNEAVTYVNMVRGRIPGLALLNSNTYTTVTDQDNMRERIRKEYGWELCGENQMYYKELRWGTWLDKKFGTNRATATSTDLNGANGMTEIWGTKRYTLNFLGDYMQRWPIPQEEIERNPNLVQNEGWQ